MGLLHGVALGPAGIFCFYICKHMCAFMYCLWFFMYDYVDTMFFLLCKCGVIGGSIGLSSRS